MKKKNKNILIDSSKLLTEPFFIKEYTEKLDSNITNRKNRKFNPATNKDVLFYLEKYFVYICRKGILFDKNKYKLSNFSKISIILATYNKAQFIEKYYIAYKTKI